MSGIGVFLIFGDLREFLNDFLWMLSSLLLLHHLFFPLLPDLNHTLCIVNKYIHMYYLNI